MNFVFAPALLILLGFAAWLDLDQRRIPNAIVAAIGLLWPPYALYDDPSAMPTSLATAAAVLALA